MATPDQVQSSLGLTGSDATIQNTCDITGGTLVEYYVVGNIPRQGVARWVRCTVSDSAATQAAAILADLVAG